VEIRRMSGSAQFVTFPGGLRVRSKTNSSIFQFGL
jgi:hypothetical protein